MIFKSNNFITKQANAITSHLIRKLIILLIFRRLALLHCFLVFCADTEPKKTAKVKEKGDMPPSLEKGSTGQGQGLLLPSVSKNEIYNIFNNNTCIIND